MPGTNVVEVILARIETKLDVALADIEDHESRLRLVESKPNERDVDHETRIRKLERALWVMAGTAAASGGILGFVINTVFKLGGHDVK